MIICLSPAKTLDFDSPDWPGLAEYRRATGTVGDEPRFVEKSRELTAILRELTADDLQKTFGVSPKIAASVYSWYQTWTGTLSSGAARPAIGVFRGEAFRGLDAATMNTADLTFAQDHLRIFSGLYGILRPFDVIEAHRLDWETRVAARSVYHFWRDQVVARLAEDVDRPGGSTIINLASTEYGRVLKSQELRKYVIDAGFFEEKDGKRKAIGVHAKRARGLLARFMIDNRMKDPDAIKGFAQEGYRFCDDTSTKNQLVFVRRSVPKKD